RSSKTKKVKSLITGALAVCMFASMAIPAAAIEKTVTNKFGRAIVIGCNEFSVKYNGNAISFPDAQPFVDANDRTLVPVRFVAEALDAWVGYSDIYNTAQIYSDVLNPSGITRLRGYEDALFASSVKTHEEWLELVPQTEYFEGSGDGFSNANEWTLRTEYGDALTKRSTFKGEKCGLTYDNNVQPAVDYAKLVMNEGIKGIEDYFSKGGIDAKLFTDLSCVFDSRHELNSSSCIRGCLLVHIPDNADIPAIQAKYGYGDIKAGETYRDNIEVTVLADIQTGLIKCYKFNIINFK
ncbi:MAG: stalk domain-containing protein, partial [Oscillospiraceae bacterium]